MAAATNADAKTLETNTTNVQTGVDDLITFLSDALLLPIQRIQNVVVYHSALLPDPPDQQPQDLILLDIPAPLQDRDDPKLDQELLEIIQSQDITVLVYTKERFTNREEPGKMVATTIVNVLMPLREYTDVLIDVQDMVLCHPTAISPQIQMITVVKKPNAIQQVQVHAGM